MVEMIQINTDKGNPHEKKDFVVDQQKNTDEMINVDAGMPQERDDISRIQVNIQQLKNDKSLLEWETESLRIDKICLEQKNHELQSRIDDLVKHYPSASVLLGKPPTVKKSVWRGMKSKLFKK